VHITTSSTTVHHSEQKETLVADYEDQFDVESILAAVSDWRSIVARATREGATRHDIVAGLRSPHVSDRLEVARAASRRNKLHLSIIHRLARDPIRDLRMVAASHKSTPADLLHTLASDRSYEVRYLVAVHRSCTMETRVLLSKDTNMSVLSAIAERPLPTEQVIALSRHKNSSIRDIIADRDDVPHEVLLRLATDRDMWVRHTVAARDTPDDLTEILVRDSDDFVVRTVAARTKLPEQFIRILADHPEPDVRSKVAARSDLPLDVSIALTRDEVPNVIDTLASSTTYEQVLVVLTCVPRAEVQRRILTNPACTLEVLHKFTRLRSEWARRIFLRHPQITPDLARPYLTNSNREIRDLARKVYPTDLINLHNDLTDAASLYWMLDTERLTPEMCFAAANRDLPVHLCLELLDHPHAPPEVRSVCISDPRAAIRAYLAGRPDINESDAITLATDRAISVRDVLIANEQCPPSAITLLIKDPDPYLRKEARTIRRAQIQQAQR
jgi:hypothetical protein